MLCKNEKVWKEVEEKAWREKEEKKRWECMEKEQGKEKEKVSDMSVVVHPGANWSLQEIVVMMLEDKAESQPPK